MFFYKYIRLNHYINKLATIIINLFAFIFHHSKLPFHGKDNATNIVIIAVHRLGDSIFTMPAINHIIDHHKSDIHIICFSETIPIFQLKFNSVNYCEISKNDLFIYNKIARSRIRKELNNLNPRVIYDLTGNFTSASIIIRSNAKQIIGVNESYFRSIYTKFTELRKQPHLIDNYLDAIRRVVPINDSNFMIQSNSNRGEYILIHPFASYSAKEWGLRNFIKLSEVINKKTKCVLISQPQKIPSDVYMYLNSKNIVVQETKTVDELIEVIKKCTMFIGNDSGPIHIANLLGKPSFTIYGPTNPDYHKPLSGINEFARKRLKCSPDKNDKICFTHGGVFCPTHDCMFNLSFEEVKKQVLSFIEKNN